MNRSAASLLVVNGVIVDFDSETVRAPDGSEVPLRAQSFAVLRELAGSGGRVVEKDALIEAVWKGVAVTDDSLVQCIGEIRRALRDGDHSILKTVRRRGYRFAVEEREDRPISARPPRRGEPFVGLAALVLVVVAGLSFWDGLLPHSGTTPSIAVLPFDDMSAKGDLRYLGEGVAEDIISMLARSPDVLVIARRSSFAYGGAPIDLRKVGQELGVEYVLEGSVRREGDRLRIVAQLSDASTGRNVWAERFDEIGRDPSALQDNVTGMIISSLTGEVGELKRAQYRDAWGRDTSRLGEYDYFLRGLDVYINAETPEENDRGGQIWAEGLEKFPNSSLLKVKLGWYNWTAAWRFWRGDMAAHFAEADRLVGEVLATDNLPPEVRRAAYWLNAFVLMQRGAFSDAVVQAEDAVAMAPYDARMLNSLSEVLIADGKYELALKWIAEAEARNPARRENSQAARANTHRLMGRYEEALAEFGALSDLSPYMHLSAAVAQVRLGQVQEARASVDRALAIDPAFTQALWREGSFYSDPAILQAEIADLSEAGLPE